MVDYLVVGSGLAGIAFAETALANGKTILVFDDDSQNSTKVAGGLFNPVILKRFSKLQDGGAQIDYLQRFYADLEFKLKLEQRLLFNVPMLRKFFSVEEQNNWFIASDKLGLSEFLSVDLVTKEYSGISSPYGFGEVLRTGYVDTAMLRSAYIRYLDESGMLLNQSVDYRAIAFNAAGIHYNEIQAKHIVFAEGFGVHANPFFNYLPLDGTKGELFIVNAPELNLDVILNTNVFILPLGNSRFKVGATYNWQDKTALPTESGKLELVARLKEILNCDFEIEEHLAGVRPTVKDRKPLLGTHPEYQNLHILNGLGTRGVMLGPYMANLLFENIENNVPLNPSIDIKRFWNKD
ncbi:FAD-dependent oxidoreductase [Flavobacterium sp.]|uniref:NAD(P)/FAD-dependent oxidoreductase n=1 Tax=Flavobacterium sp. TaxID=239 RepID=UPI00260DB65E|nr:FAD-dependent oxidoreductase [Flavobacterium sp.]